MYNARLKGYQLLSIFTQTTSTTTHFARRDPQDPRRYLLLTAKQPLPASEVLRRSVLLDHPNLCKIVERSEDEDEFFIATEVQGEPFPQLVERIRSAQGRVPIPVIFFITAEVCAGLSYALQQEGGPLVHRYLRPEFIFVSALGGVLLYGIGSVAESLRYDDEWRPPALVLPLFDGINYNAPELFNAPAQDTRADLFSLGSVLYEIFSGRLPFASDSPVQVLARIIRGELEPLRRVAPGLPEEVYQIVEKMMRNKKEERYQSPKELADELHGYLSELGGRGLRFDLGALVRVFRGPWIPPYGPYSGYLLRELGKLTKTSWLYPDPELESASPEVIDWMEQRIDEHLGALSSLVEEALLPSVKVRITRSLFEAQRLFQASQSSSNREITSWKRAISVLRKRTEALCRCTPQLAASFEAVCEEALAMAALGPTLSEAHQRTLSFWWESNQQNPAAQLIKAHASFLMIFGELPSPWAPLVSIWARGAWPLTFSEDGFLIYLPVLHQGTLVPEPQDPSSTRGLPGFAPLL